jgi:hypothetical protein
MRAALITAMVGLASASNLFSKKHDGYGPGGYGPDGYGPGGYFGGYSHNHDSPGAFFNGYGSSNPPTQSLSNNDLAKLQTIPWGKAVDARMAHAVLASLAFVIFFPFGAISIRVLPGRLSLILHGAFQIFGYILYIVAVGLGIWIAVTVQFSDFHLVSLSTIPLNNLVF